MEMRTGFFSGSLTLPTGELTLAEFTTRIFALADQVNQHAVDVALEDGQARITCKAGCGACCRQAVPTTLPEALVLQNLLQSAAPSQRAAIESRFTFLQNQLHSSQLDLNLQAGETEDGRWGRITARYFALAMPCPFLENESCSIYEKRPTVCRDFLVTSPAKECGDFASEDVVCITMPISLPHCLARLAAMLMGGEPQLLPMSLALDWARQTSEWQTKRFDATMLFTSFFDIVKAQADLWRGATSVQE
jgi:Fe-S-cluster containining protein